VDVAECRGVYVGLSACLSFAFDILNIPSG